MAVEGAFVGGAGTGKTYRLIETVEGEAMARGWAPHESILALTFMHGARRRLHHRFGDLRARGVPVQVETIDAFCLRLVNRFRRSLGRDLRITPSSKGNWERGVREWKATFKEIEQAAANLLQNPMILDCVVASHPILVVDEFQDCNPDLVGVIDGLSRGCRMFLAADEFQHLEIDSTACPATAWLVLNSSPTQLTENKRTSINALLESADALRDGTPRTGCIPTVFVSAGGLAAWEIARRLQWDGWRKGTVALITPASRAKSDFVKKTLSSLERELGQKKRIGPYPFRWLGAGEAAETRVSKVLSKKGKGHAHVGADCLLAAARGAEDRLARATCAAAYRRMRLRGEDSIELGELENIERVLSSQCPPLPPKRVALTVHGAKNQEYDRVFILWPYELKSDSVYRRKLLYNAITRARLDAVVLVQGSAATQGTDETLCLLQT